MPLIILSLNTFFCLNLSYARTTCFLLHYFYLDQSSFFYYSISYYALSCYSLSLSLILSLGFLKASYRFYCKISRQNTTLFLMTLSLSFFLFLSFSIFFSFLTILFLFLLLLSYSLPPLSYYSFEYSPLLLSLSDSALSRYSSSMTSLS